MQICKCGCGQEFEKKRPDNMFFSRACGRNYHNKIISIERAKRSKKQASIFEKTNMIRLMQIRLRKEFHVIILEIEQTLYPKEEKPDERTWIERKYPTTYPSLSDDFRKFERG
jgi:hypothetical protein